MHGQRRKFLDEIEAENSPFMISVARFRRLQLLAAGYEKNRH